MINIVGADVDSGREFEMIVDFGSPHSFQVVFETFEMEDQVVRHILETGPEDRISLTMQMDIESTYLLTASTNFPPQDSHLYLLSPSITSPSTKACRLS